VGEGRGGGDGGVELEEGEEAVGGGACVLYVCGYVVVVLPHGAAAAGVLVLCERAGLWRCRGRAASKQREHSPVWRFRCSAWVPHDLDVELAIPESSTSITLPKDEQQRRCKGHDGAKQRKQGPDPVVKEEMPVLWWAISWWRAGSPPLGRPDREEERRHRNEGVGERPSVFKKRRHRRAECVAASTFFRLEHKY